jgi:poly(hydroxyalkanoate) depolymerase family esterase
VVGVNQALRRAAKACTLGVVATAFFSVPAYGASIVEVTSFGTNPGNLQMFKYIPDALPSNAPLVVAMHGANSDYTLMANVTGWRELADRYQFALLMPQQKSANNTYKAFNFHQAADNTRGNGEALSIKQMIDNVKANHSIDATKVFATGFSAGAHMTSVMLATYPEVFNAGHPYAGGAYACSASSTADCGSAPNKTPQQWGDAVRAQNPSYNGPWPRVFVGQGDADNLNNFAWMQEIVDQWTNVHGIDQTADTTDTVKGFPHKVYRNGSGVSEVETITMTGLGHKMSVDPGTAVDQCGTTDWIASEDTNMCIAYQAAVYFGIVSGSPPPPPPPPPPPGGGTTLVLDDVDANDGYVKANSDGTSPEVGTLETTTGLGMGRSTAAPYKYMRTLLAFDTSGIPDTATITRAYLTVTAQTFGGNAWSDPTGNQLVIDVKDSCFGAACTTATDDWAALPNVSGSASLAQFSTGSRQSSDFDYAGLSVINKTGTTQLKLRFSAFQTALYYITVYGGGNATNRPKLTVVYQ